MDQRTADELPEGVAKARYQSSVRETSADGGLQDVDEAKLSAFASGQARKSKWVRERDAAEAKRKEQDALAALAYKDFVTAFESDGSRPQVFVRAGQGSSSYDAPEPSSKRTVATAFAADEEAAVEPMAAVVPSTTSSGVPASHKKRRAGDSFLQELKRKDAERKDRLASKASKDARGYGVAALAAMEAAPQAGSRDAGDPLTTNVHVANLPPDISDLALGSFCAGRFGPVASLKIMWPRPGNELGGGAGFAIRQRQGLNGFVAFMRRTDAERACRELDGYNWGGNILGTGWGKAMTIGPRPLYVDPEAGDPDRADARSKRRSPTSERPRRSRSRSWDRRRRRTPSPDRVGSEAAALIEAVVQKVKEHGSRFESTLKEREKHNGRFDFLWDEQLSAHRYYRKLLDRPPHRRPIFEDEGHASVFSSDSSEDSENERVGKGKLGTLARKRFHAMLRALTPHRESVARCMAFALQHADAADEIADILVASLTIDMTPIPRKMARLYVVSDILHNSSASLPTAWKYRQTLEKALPPVFDHLNVIYRSFPGRMKAEGFRKQVGAVLAVWDAFMVFPQTTLSDLGERLAANDETEGTGLESVGASD